MITTILTMLGVFLGGICFGWWLAKDIQRERDIKMFDALLPPATDQDDIPTKVTALPEKSA